MKSDELENLISIRNKLIDIAGRPNVFVYSDGMLVITINSFFPTDLKIEDYPIQEQIISSARKSLFYLDSRYRPVLNPIAVGHIIASIETIMTEEKQPSGWNSIHVSQQRQAVPAGEKHCGFY